MLGKLRIALAMVMAVCVMASCTVFHSLDVGEDGIIYYLPKTLVEVTITPWGRAGKDADGPIYAIDHLVLDVASPENKPDIRYPYVLQYDASRFSHDRLCVAADKGLLQFVEVATDDKTDDIIVSIAKLFGRLAGPSAFTADVRQDESTIGPLEAIKLVMTIDPLDPRDVEAVNQRIVAAYGQHWAEGAARYRFSVPDAAAMRGQEGYRNCPVDAVCYRTAVSTRFLLSGPGGYSSSAHTDVVNQAIVGHVGVTRAFMVEKVTKLGFDGGVLKSVAISKPSEVLAVAQLPLTVYDAVLTSALAAPGKLLANIGGLPAEQQVAMIKQLAENTAQIQNLEASLASIRESGISDGAASVGDGLFTVRCTGSGT
ncbi:MAG: hypothetical protein GC150_01805 [Rhizobiales bacterium]|nr:hypothetical protein [Hyphomicrobiales bacterium]